MNRSYNIIWSHAKNMFVVASELSHGNSRIKSQVRASGLGMALMLAATASMAAELGPQSGASIALQDGDVVTSTEGGIGIDSTETGGSGVQIDGHATVNVSGDSGSIGMKLDNNETNNLGSGTVINVVDTGTTTNSGTFGIDIDKNNPLTAIDADNLQINVSAQKSAYGIYAYNTQGLINLGENSVITVKSATSNAYGIYLNNNDGNFSADNATVNVTVDKGQAYGIYLDESEANLGDNTHIALNSNSSATGLTLKPGSALNANNLKIDITGSGYSFSGIQVVGDSTADIGAGSSINLSGNISYSYGISASTGSSFTATDLAITSTTTYSGNSYFHGVDISGGYVDLGTGSTISETGYTSGFGIIQSSYPDAIFKADDLTIDVTGANVYGIQQESGTMDLGSGSSVSADGSSTTIWILGGSFTADELTVKTAQSTGITAQSGDDSLVVSIGAGSIVDGREVGASGKTNGICIGYDGLGGSETGVFNFNGTADNRNTIYAVNGYGASAQFSGQTLNISNTDIIMSGDKRTYGLWAIGDYSFTDAGIINGENLTIDMTALEENGYGVVVQQGGIVNLSGDTTILTDNGVAIWNPKVTNSSTPNLVYQGGTITGTGKMDIVGDIVNSGWGYIDLTMDAGSYFEGATSINQDLGPDNSSLVISMAAQSEWQMTGPSSLSTLDNGGKIIFSEDSDNGVLSTLDADKMTLEKSSELDINLSTIPDSALITGNDITLAGNLQISAPDTSDITSDTQLQSFTLIDASSAIKGNFDTLSMGQNSVDYLALGGWIDPDDNTKYDVGVGLSWYAGNTLSSTPAHGTFTLDAGQSFEVTQTLADVDAQSATGWDGRTLSKKGDGTLILSGNNTYSDGTHIDSGTLVATDTDALGSGDIDNSGWLLLDAEGQFALTQNLITHAGGVTQIAEGSSLQVDRLIQDEESTLDISLDLSASAPVITAQEASLDGTLNISGITGEPDYSGEVTIIDAEQAISGSFDQLTVAGMPADQVDFITVEGRISRTDNTQYELTYGLNWYAESYNALTPAHGNFTINDANESFTLATPLTDVAPDSATGWDGKSLYKMGDGALILSASETYSGDTLVEEGTLWLAEDASVGVTDSDQNVNIAQGATFGGSDRSMVNGNISNQGTLRFDDTVTVNGDVSNDGELLSGTGDAPVTSHGYTSNNSPDSTLIINGNYTSNGGSLTLNTQLGDDSSASDKLIVNGNTAGDTTLYINNAGGDGAQTDKGIEVVEVSGTSDGTFTQGNQVQAGLYEYRLYEDSGDWYLRSAAEDNGGGDDDNGGGDDDGGDDNGGDTPVTPQYRPDIGAYLGNQWMARHLQMQTLYDRESSQYHSTDGSVWARFKAGKAESTAADGNIDNDHHYSQFQLGGDIATWSNGLQSLNVGVMGSYINADTDSTGNRGADGSQFTASGNVQGYNLGLYASWFADAKTHSGVYIDSWYQYGIFNNSVDDGSIGREDYDSTASAVSLETGYRYDIALDSGNTVSLIPQAQVVWQNYDADSVTDQSGTHIDGQHSDSWNSRTGLRVEGKLHSGANLIQPFAEINWLHSTDDNVVSFDDAQVKQDLPANRGELKLGVQANIVSQWSVRLQAAGQTGDNGYSDLNGSLNIRYNW
ncbi:TPA: autotransporter outer membrane beta-barrel domain-containing protein [Citrobacter amalonaticus]|nr:autotransporter outer membrane beta-barrel domain-containing protein [Citrobacter amalonaticus]